MNSYSYKFYPSILDCFQHYLDADKEFEDAFNIDADGNYKVSLDDITEARLQELLDRINRVPREPIPAADKGTCFNMLVDIVAANPIALVRQGDQYDCYSMEMNGAEYRYSRQLIDKLIGTEFTREAVEKALEGTDIGSIILNCDNQKFSNTIFTP